MEQNTELEQINESAKQWLEKDKKKHAIIVMSLDESSEKEDKLTCYLGGTRLNIIAMLCALIEKNKDFGEIHHDALGALMEMKMHKMFGKHNEETEDNGTKE